MFSVSTAPVNKAGFIKCHDIFTTNSFSDVPMTDWLHILQKKSIEQKNTEDMAPVFFFQE